MCRDNNKLKTFKWNTQISRLIIITGLTILGLQNAGAMPSRDFRQSAATSSNTEDRAKELEDPKSEFEERKYNQNRSEGPGSTLSFRSGSAISKPFVDADVIKYPGDWETSKMNLVPQPSPNCEGKTFCEDTVSSYPQEYLSNIIKKTESVKLFSGVDQIEFADRFDSSDADLCGSETKIVFPKTAQKADKEWLFILQDERQGYKQGVKIENCDTGTNEGACKIIEGSVYGYKSSCKQKYVSRVMAAVHPNGTAVTENFSMPSSCCCQLKLVGEGIGNRSGGITPKGQKPPAMKAGQNR